MTQYLGFGLLAVALAAQPDESKLPTAEPVGHIEVVVTFNGPMPTGVTVSSKGRIFINFPRWGDEVEFTVAELKNGRPVPYPDAAFNRLGKDRPAKCLVSVQSVVVDADDRLWLLDTGSVEFGSTLPGGPKLVGVDLTTNKVFQTIRFPKDVALETTHLNDIRFDLRRGKGGVAFITDSSPKGPNGMIVVDLATGQSRRRLHGQPSTKAAKNFLPIVEGRPLLNRPEGGKPTHMTIGADGIAISQDGKHLYHCPLTSRQLYRVRTDVLLDEWAGDEDVAKSVRIWATAGSPPTGWSRTTRVGSI
jgi:sugar lactone lactonase YvrE